MFELDTTAGKGCLKSHTASALCLMTSRHPKAQYSLLWLSVTDHLKDTVLWLFKGQTQSSLNGQNVISKCLNTVISEWSKFHFQKVKYCHLWMVKYCHLWMVKHCHLWMIKYCHFWIVKQLSSLNGQTQSFLNGQTANSQWSNIVTSEWSTTVTLKQLAQVSN